jgi:hypothetical protein
MGVNKTVNFDDREVSEVGGKPKEEENEMDRVD